MFVLDVFIIGLFDSLIIPCENDISLSVLKFLNTGVPEVSL